MRYSSTVPVAASHAKSIAVGEIVVAVSEPGTPGGLGCVVADAASLNAEQPPALRAGARRAGDVSGVRPVSLVLVSVPGSVSCNANAPPSTCRSMRYSSTVPAASSHAKSIAVGEIVVAVSEPGTPGGLGCVVAEASPLNAEQPPALQA